MSPEWVVVGLGNPGSKYSSTRHNVGFWAVDALSTVIGVRISQEKMGCLFGRGDELLLVKPQKYMNCSGEALAPLVRYFKIEPDRVVVIHDDVDLQTGSLRVKRGGGAGGQHGVEDIVNHLGTPEFYRVRIGVGRAPGSLPGEDVSSWVLGEPKGEERSTLEITAKSAAECALTITREGLEAASQKYSRKNFHLP